MVDDPDAFRKRIEDWLVSEEGQAAVAKVRENAEKRARALTPGTEEYYQEFLAQRRAQELWDNGPFL